MQQERSAQLGLMDYFYQVVLPALDLEQELANLNPRDSGRVWEVDCPDCFERNAYIFKDGHKIICRRQNNCGQSTTVLDYLGAKGKLGPELVEVIKPIAARSGNPLPEREYSPEDQRRYEERERKQLLLDTFLAFSMEQLHTHGARHAREFLLARQFDEKTWEDLEFGFYPSQDEVLDALKGRGFTESEIIVAGLYPETKDGRAPRSAWNNRLVGPWRESSERIGTFWSRDLTGTCEQGAKYMLLKGTRKEVLFGLHRARGCKRVVLMEGVLDVLALHARGHYEAVGLGGCILNEEHVRQLTSLRLETLTLNLDYDPQGAGAKGIDRALNLLRKAPFAVYVVDPVSMVENGNISAKVDPESYLRTHTPEEYGALLRAAPRAALYKAESELRGKDLSTQYNRDKALDELFRYDQELTDPVDRADLWRTAAEKTGYPIEVLVAKADSIRERLERERIKSDLRDLIQKQGMALASGETEEVMRSLSDGILSLNARTLVDEPASFSVDALMNTIRREQDGKLSGWEPLDAKGILFNPCELAVLAARTAHGKTTALISLLINWLTRYPNEHFIVYSHELPEQHWFIKMACAITGRDGIGWGYYQARDYVKGAWKGGDAPSREIEDAFGLIKSFEGRFHLVHRPNWSIEQIELHARRIYDRTGGKLGGVFADYLQRIPPPADRKFDRRDIEVSAVALGLKRISVALKCPVVTAAQLNREAAKQNDKIPTGEFESKEVQDAIQKRRPQLHHVREGGVEQESDLVLGLLNYRADYQEIIGNAEGRERGKAGPFEVIALKSRFGETGAVKMYLDGPTGHIRGPRAGEV